MKLISSPAPGFFVYYCAANMAHLVTYLKNPVRFFDTPEEASKFCLDHHNNQA